MAIDVDARSAAAPGMTGSAKQVVILDEGELDCDLATAIQRVRGAAETARSQILVIAPEAAEEAPSLPEPALPADGTQAVRRAQQDAVEGLARHLAPVTSTLGHFMEEQRQALDVLRDRVEEGGSAALRASSRLLDEILEWIEAATEDLNDEVKAAAQGYLSVPTAPLIEEAAAALQEQFPRIQVDAGPSPAAICRGRPAELAEALFLAMVLVAHRIGGEGTLRVEVVVESDRVEHRIVGQGEVCDVAAPTTFRRFRRLVVANRGRVDVGATGVDGAGLTLVLRRSRH